MKGSKQVKRSDSLGFGLGVCDLADVDGVGGVRDVSLLLHVRGGDGQQGSVHTERQRRDAGRVTVELTQTLLVERIPNVHEAVGTACAQTQTESLSESQNSSLFEVFSPQQNEFILHSIHFNDIQVTFIWQRYTDIMSRGQLRRHNKCVCNYNS